MIKQMLPTMHERKIIVVIRLVLSNMDLHWEAGPQRKKLLASEQKVPSIYKIENLVMSPLIKDLSRPLEISEIRKPMQNSMAQPFTLVLRVILGHRLLFFCVLSMNN